jgi:hypothetical protein
MRGGGAGRRRERNNPTYGASYFGTLLAHPRRERRTMSRLTYGISAVLALGGTAIAVCEEQILPLGRRPLVEAFMLYVGLDIPNWQQSA